MAGDYLFPKRLFKDGEPLETNEVNEVVVEAGERLNGHLNQHNIRAPINASVLAAEGTFYRTFTVTEDADPKVVHASSGSPPQGPQPQNAFDVGQNTSWQVIESSKAMAVELETGKSMLAMTAHVSHCYQNDDASVREVWRFTMPSLADFGFTQQQYVDFFDEDTNRLEVEIYLDAPGSADASRTYLAILPAPPPLSSFSSFFAALLKNPQQMYRGDAAFATAVTLPTVGYADANTNGGGYFASRSGSDLLFTSIQSGSSGSSPTFLMRFSLILKSPMFTATTTFTATVTGARDQEASGAIGQTFSELASYVSGTKTLNYFAAQAQYAFRVDGAVISESITGRFDNELRTVRPLIRQEPLEGSRASAGGSPSTYPVSSNYNRFPNRPDAVNIPMYSSRLTASIEVEPGAHLVELVVRRVPCGKRQDFELTPPPQSTSAGLTPVVDRDNRLMIYNRMLSVTEVPLESRSSSLFESAVETPTYENDDVISRDSLFDKRLQPLVNASNDVQTFQLGRGAINGTHLGDYSTVLAVAQKGRTNDLSFFANDFPYRRATGGLDLTTQIKLMRAEPGAATDWKNIVEANLSRTISAGTACTLTVEGNVFLRRLQTDAPDTSIHTGGAFFCIALESGGEWYLYLPSQGWVNSNNYFLSVHSGTGFVSYVSFFDDQRVIGAPTPLVDLKGRDYVDVPVTMVLQFPATGNDALLVDITGVAIFGAAAYMANAAGSGTGPRNQDTQVVVARASVNAVAVKS